VARFPTAGRNTIVNPPSGRQFEISAAGQRATIVEVGGGIRAYSAGGQEVLQPYPADAMCDGAHGAVLIPWPNRLADGRYRFDGTDYQVALSEPDKHNAVHGFLRWRPWLSAHHTPDQIVMTATLCPAEGYPFALEAEVDYRLDDAGLTVTTTATNTGDWPCPYGCGQHPYLSPGAGPIDDCTLYLTAGTRILTDPARQLPTGTEPVDGTLFDFRDGPLLGALQVDHAFADLARDESGRARVRLAGPDGHTAELWVDQSYPVIEIYTGDTLAPGRRRRGLGVEPMTCPPNALQTGESMIRLEPGQSVTTTWGARLTVSGARG
jgi:aldose 1-epimerase